MIAINSAMLQEKIKDLLDGKEIDGFTYAYKDKQGIKLIFENTGDSAEAANAAKLAIKKEEWAAALYFNAAAV